MVLSKIWTSFFPNISQNVSSTNLVPSMYSIKVALNPSSVTSSLALNKEKQHYMQLQLSIRTVARSKHAQYEYYVWLRSHLRVYCGKHVC